MKLVIAKTVKKRSTRSILLPLLLRQNLGFRKILRLPLHSAQGYILVDNGGKMGAKVRLASRENHHQLGLSAGPAPTQPNPKNVGSRSKGGIEPPTSAFFTLTPNSSPAPPPKRRQVRFAKRKTRSASQSRVARVQLDVRIILRPTAQTCRR
jgi:hypothetical protein